MSQTRAEKDTSPQGQNDYVQLRKAGFTDDEIQAHMRPRLMEAGFSDQEINAYFLRQQVGEGTQEMSAKATLGQYFSHGLQGSVAGLWWNEKLPDAVTEHQMQEAGLLDRLALGVGQMVGDLPSLVGGGALGALGGPSAPVTIPAGAMALTEGLRASYMKRIAEGHTEDFAYLSAIPGVLGATAKGYTVGAATGGAGVAAGRGAALGAGAAAKTAATAAAETATMPTAGAALEGRLPHPHEFVDAALFVGTMHGMRAGIAHVPDLVPKLRNIYARTGKTPEEVAMAAQGDPTVRQDLLAVNRDVPEAFATELLERAKAGEKLSPAELAGYRDRSWAQALLNEQAGPEAIKSEIASVTEKAVQGDFRNKAVWGFVGPEEANALSQQTNLPITAGYSHIIDGSSVRHILNRHGNQAVEDSRGQIAIMEADFQRVPDIVRRHDKIEYAGKDKLGRDVIRYEKSEADGTIVVIEEVRSKRYQLALQSMRKMKSTGADSQPPLTSETLMGRTLASNAAKQASVNAKIDGTAPRVNPESVQHTGGQTSVPVASDKSVLPEGGLRHEDAVSLSALIEDLGKALDVPIRTGKMRPAGRGALGIFKVKPEVIRTRLANDVATIMHEAGHFIHKAVFGSMDDTPLRPFAGELSAIATKPRKGQSLLPEGFAEFVAKYVVNPAEAQRVAPHFYAHFERLLQDAPTEFGTALLNAREVVRRWAEQPAAQEVLSHISVEGREGGGLLARALSRESWDRLYTNFVDRLYPLKKATEALANGEELPADINPYTLARTFAGAKGKAAHFIEHSPFKFTTWENVGKPLAATLRAVENLDEFRAYLVSRRGLELEARGIKSGVRPEAMRATREQLAKKYEPLARELDEYQDHLVAYLVDSGLMGRESAAAMREMNRHYVPFFRLMDGSQAGFLGGGKNLSARNPIRRIKGSGRDIVDPLESIIKNTYAMIEAAEKNAVGRALTDLAARTEGSGWLVEKLPEPKAAVRVHREAVNRAFLSSLGDLDSGTRANVEALLRHSDTGDMITFWQNAAMLDKRSQIAVYCDGKRQVYQVAPELAEVMNGLNAETVPLLVKLAAIPAKMLRAGATLTPDFMVRNLLRDAISTGVVSRSGFIPGLDTARGLKRAVTKDATYWNWGKAGGDQASLVSMDRTTLQKTLTDITATGYPERVWNVVRNPLELLRLGSELSEKMTRLGEFGKAVQKHGGDKAGLMRAAYEARDIMDFSRRGRLTASFNIMTAFFNASVQGLDRAARSFVENPRRFVVRAALFVGIPSILNAIRNYGDEDIAEVPRAQRDMFWCVPIGESKGKTILRIPKPFEQGVMFGSTLERATEFMLDAYFNKYGSIAKAREEAFRGLGASILDVSLPNAVPTAFTPLIESFANRSLTFDRPIVPINREGLLPEYQYTPYTTELMKSLARAVGTLPPLGEMQTFSPARGENFVRAWMGGLGMYTLQALDAMGRKAGLLPDPVKPAATLADIPFVRAFIVRNPSMGAESIQRFYDSYDKAHRYLQTINALQQEFKYDDVANLIPYSVYQAMEGPRKTLGEITKAVSLIHNTPDMTPDQKRQMIDVLYFRAIDTAKLGNQVFEALQPDLEKLKRRAAE